MLLCLLCELFAVKGKPNIAVKALHLVVKEIVPSILPFLTLGHLQRRATNRFSDR